MSILNTLTTRTASNIATILDILISLILVLGMLAAIYFQNSPDYNRSGSIQDIGWKNCTVKDTGVGLFVPCSQVSPQGWVDLGEEV